MDITTKKERNLIIITVALVIILIVCTIYDRNSALIGRTLAYDLPEGAKIVKMEKHGFSFYRLGYEAKILVDASNPEEVLQCFVDGYNFSGSMMSGSEYQQVSEMLFGEDGQFSYAKIQPNPAQGSGIWMCEVITEEGHTIVQLLDIESGDQAYLYIYYAR